MKPNLSDLPTFRTISPGRYDNLIECSKCGFRCCESIDASREENKIRIKHDCDEHIRKRKKLFGG